MSTTTPITQGFVLIILHENYFWNELSLHFSDFWIFMMWEVQRWEFIKWELIWLIAKLNFNHWIGNLFCHSELILDFFNELVQFEHKFAAAIVSIWYTHKIANKTFGTCCRDSEIKCSNKVMGLLPDDLWFGNCNAIHFTWKRMSRILVIGRFGHGQTSGLSIFFHA